MIKHPRKRLEYEKARRLRLRGLSYNEIRKVLNFTVAKSNLSLWLKDIVLTPKQRERLYTKQVQILSRGPHSQRERRQKEIGSIIETAKMEISYPLSSEAYRLMGAALYWAEGSKGGLMEFTNSDPYLILFFVRWIEKVFSISPVDLTCSINMYVQQNEMDLKQFWSKLTGIPLVNFRKSYVKPANKGYKKNNLYYGTFRVGVPKSVDMKHRIFGWLQWALQREIQGADIVQEQWKSLREVSRPANLD